VFSGFPCGLLWYRYRPYPDIYQEGECYQLSL
jgi:hypothetical protein